MDGSLQELFEKHIDKISSMPPGRHLKHGMPYFVNNVTRQARLIYDWEDNTLLIVRCFADHKHYEDWYQSYK